MKQLSKVFSVATDCHAQTGHYRSLWQRHFYAGLRGAIQTLVVPQGIDFDWARGRGAGESVHPQCRAETSEKLWLQIKAARESGIEAVISYCFASDIEPALVRDTIQSGIPWVNFYCDSTHRFGEVEDLARIVSLNWFPEHAAISKYQALGVPFICHPYALNPAFLPDCRVTSPQRAVVFIGMPTTNRITQLGALHLLGYPVAVRGLGWMGDGQDPFRSAIAWHTRLTKALASPGLWEKLARRALWPKVRQHVGGPLGDEELADYLRGSQIVLGLNQGRDEGGHFLSYLKFRDLEFPGYGCCYLTERNEDIEGALEIGEEVIAYRTMRDAARQIRALLESPERIGRIGGAGRKRVLGEHVWTTRIRQIAEHL